MIQIDLVCDNEEHGCEARTHINLDDPYENTEGWHFPDLAEQFEEDCEPGQGNAGIALQSMPTAELQGYMVLCPKCAARTAYEPRMGEFIDMEDDLGVGRN